MAEAMAKVREAMGPDAIIVSTYEGRRGRGVEVKAAIESPPLAAHPPTEDWMADLEARLRERLFGEMAAEMEACRALRAEGGESPSAPPGVNADWMTRALKFHGFQADTGKALLRAAGAVEAEHTEDALAAALDLRCRFDPIAETPSRPLMLIGAPGAGKTATAAKLAARSVLSGTPVAFITADTVKAGAVQQIASYAELLEQPMATADSPEELRAACESQAGRVRIIDTPGANPFNRTEMRDLERFVNAVDAEPILVMAAGGDPGDMTDAAHLYKRFGIKRMIVTRIDAARRFGGPFSAADEAGLALAQISASPYVADGLLPLTPLTMARLLLDVPLPKDAPKDAPKTGRFAAARAPDSQTQAPQAQAPKPEGPRSGIAQILAAQNARRAGSQ